MTPIKDRSTEHRTTLETLVTIGHRTVRVSADVPGRDAWAYQTAKVRLQEAVIAQRRASTPLPS